jgi:hypothetical protein
MRLVNVLKNISTPKWDPINVFLSSKVLSFMLEIVNKKNKVIIDVMEHMHVTQLVIEKPCKNSINTQSNNN